MTQGRPPAWRLQHHTSLPSTQEAALAAARAGDPGRLAILADTQTAGRASRGRSWSSPRGNLNLSLLLRPADLTPDPGRHALLAALTLHAALSPYSPDLLLKWPNDVTLHGAKLAGILIDCTPGEALVIGLGANLAAAPDLPDRATTHLPGPAPPPAAVAAHILTAWDHWATQETPALVTAWLARAHPIGTLLSVHTAQRHLHGSFAGLTSAGLLRLDGHADAISSAEVFFA